MSHHDAVHKLGKLIEGIHIAMLTTVETDGSLRSRPMATLDMEFDGDLWFFTQVHSGKVDELKKNNHANVAYSNPDTNQFVSISGTVELIQDRERMARYWKPFLKAWFPGGVEDPNLGLLRVAVEKAEYWDAPSGAMTRITGFLTGLAGTRGMQPQSAAHPLNVPKPNPLRT